MKKTMLNVLVVLAYLLLSTTVFAQIGGNQIYNSRSNSSISSVSNFVATDSTLTINVNVLLNQSADSFMMTLGVIQEEKTTQECINNINQRINDFLSKIEKIGIKKSDTFINFISQTKVFDLDFNSKNVEQVHNGFVTKKNIIIKIDQYDKIEKIIIEASKNEIYDVVKVDYINNDISAIYDKLLTEAAFFLNKKRDNYWQKFDPKFIGDPKCSDNFYYIFPKSQYKEYTAYESDEFNDNSKSYRVKLARKNKTHYYEGIDYSGFDKVINNLNPIIGIQYVLNLAVIYTIERRK